MKNICALLVAVLPISLSAAAQTPLPKMELYLQALDGNPSDIVGPSDITGLFPADLRVWQIQGRRRGQVRISDRERMFFDEDKNFATRIQFAAIDLESDFPEEHRLFTLTERKVQQLDVGTAIFPAVIRVDNISVPSSPDPIQDLTFGLEPSENPGYICTIPGQKKLIVLMLPVLAEDSMDPPTVPAELRIYNYENTSLTLELDPIAVAQIPTGETGCITPKKFRTLLSAQVESIQVPGAGDERMALINATLVNATIAAGCAPKAPLPSGLLVCNVDDPFNPFFYATDLTKQAWDPCRSAGDPCLDWRIGGFAHVRTAGGDDLVYAVGGAQIDLTELDLTGVADHQIGIVENPITYSLDPDDLLCAVRADPAPSPGSDFLYVIGRKKAYVVDRENLGSPGFFQEAAAGFGHSGPAGDVQLMLADPEAPGTGPDQREIWTLAGQQASHVFRITDFTQDGGALDAPDVSEKYYSAGPTDGAVANFGWDSVYTITFGGVVRWDISGSEPIPLADSYQPAFSSVTGIDYTTEHLELVNLGTFASPAFHLIATTAAGSFFAWPLDASTHDPLPGAVYQPPPGYWPGWTTGFTYGNDIATAPDPTTGAKWIFVDYSNVLEGEIGIGRYNWTTPSLSAAAVVWEDPTPGILPDIDPLAHDIAVEGDKWLLVAARGGFIVINRLTGQKTDWVYTNNVGKLSFSDVMGIDKNGYRIFASLGDGTNRFAFAMYGFDPDTGHVVDANGQHNDEPIQVLFDGQKVPTEPGEPEECKPDDFPGVFVSEGEKISLIVTQATPKKLRLYSGSGNGNVLEIEWQSSNDTMTPLSYWNNGGYFNLITDCNVYTDTTPLGGASFGPVIDLHLRVIVAKAQETFEIVIPPGME